MKCQHCDRPVRLEAVLDQPEPAKVREGWVVKGMNSGEYWTSESGWHKSLGTSCVYLTEAGARGAAKGVSLVKVESVTNDGSGWKEVEAAKDEPQPFNIDVAVGDFFQFSTNRTLWQVRGEVSRPLPHINRWMKHSGMNMSEVVPAVLVVDILRSSGWTVDAEPITPPKSSEPAKDQDFDLFTFLDGDIVTRYSVDATTTWLFLYRGGEAYHFETPAEIEAITLGESTPEPGAKEEDEHPLTRTQIEKHLKTRGFLAKWPEAKDQVGASTEMIADGSHFDQLGNKWKEMPGHTESEELLLDLVMELNDRNTSLRNLINAVDDTAHTIQRPQIEELTRRVDALSQRLAAKYDSMFKAQCEQGQMLASLNKQVALKL